MIRKTFTPFILFFLFFALHDLNAASKIPSRDKSLEEVEKDLQDKFGPIVKPERAPNLYKTLQNLFEDLSNAHEKIAKKEERLIINHFYIIDVLMTNAFVMHLSRPGIAISENIVVVTTQLLKEMSETVSGKKLKNEEHFLFLKRIAGILAHELAHPFDDYDKDGMKSSYTAQLASQAREIRADIEGGLITKEAGHGQDCVYEALTHLFQKKQKTVSDLEISLSSHPEKNLRLRTQALFLTASRFKKDGQIEGDFPHEIPEEIFHELDSFFDENISYKKDELGHVKSLKTAVSEFKKISEGKISKSDFSRKEILSLNYLLMFIGNELSDKNELDDLSIEDRLAFQKWIKGILSGEIPLSFGILKKGEFYSLAQNQGMKNDIKKSLAWTDFVDKTPFFRSETYLNLIENELREIYHGDWRSLSSSIKKVTYLTYLAHSPSLFDFVTFSLNKVLENFTNEAAKKNDPIFNLFSIIIQEVRFENRALMTYEFAKDNLFELSDEELFKNLLLKSENYAKTKDIFPFSRSMEKEKRTDIGIKSLIILKKDKTISKTFESHKKWMQFLWEKRNVLILLDFSRSFSNIDWDYIWKTLDISERDGREELNKSVKAVTTSPFFVEILKKIEDEELYDSYNSKYNIFEFYGNNLASYFSGEKNKLLDEEDDLKKIARKKFLDPYLFASNSEKNLGLWFNSIIKKFGNDSLLNREELIAKLDSFLERYYGPSSVNLGYKDFFRMLDISLEQLDPKFRKDFFYDLIYTNKININGFDRFKNGEIFKKINSDELDELFHVLLKHKIYSQKLEFYKDLSLAPFLKKMTPELMKMSLVKNAPWFFEESFSDIEKENNFQELFKMAKLMFDPGKKIENLKIIEGSSHGNRKLKQQFLFIISYYNRKLSLEDKLHLFLVVTTHGFSTETDSWFEAHILPQWSNLIEEKMMKFLKELLMEKRIGSHQLQMQILEKSLDFEIERIKRDGVDKKDIVNLIKIIRLYVPGASENKDRFLEKIAFELQLEGLQLKTLIEDQKSTNWKMANPVIVNFASVLSNVFKNLDDRMMSEMILYIQAPENSELPNVVKRKLYLASYNVLLEKAKKEKSGKFSVKELRLKAQELSEREALQFELAVQDASLLERTMLNEIILNSRGTPKTEFLLKIAEEYGGYLPESVSRKLLEAYLNIIPEHEKSVTISYLLAGIKERGSIKSLFEIFQTVGIKFGQLAAIWNLFGEDITYEIKDLKDKAKALSKYEIEKIIEKEYGEKSQRIKILKILGSASIKTAVEVKIDGSENAVLLVRRPFVKDQVALNLELAFKLLKEIEKMGVEIPQGLLTMILEDLGSQLEKEIDFRKEALQMEKAKMIFDKINLQKKPGEFVYFVPQVKSEFPVNENIMIVDKAYGENWERGKINNVGETLYTDLLRAFTETGFFNPDSHAGNIMIDQEKKIISLLDMAQVENYTMVRMWGEDDRLKVLNFLKAINKKDSEEVFNALWNMSERTSLSYDSLHAEALRNLENLWKRTKNMELDEIFVEIITSVSSLGLKIERKFSFGIIKGLIILIGEKYVPHNTALNILKNEFTILAKKKWYTQILNKENYSCFSLIKLNFF